MNPNRKLKLKRENQIRKLDEFTEDELKEIKDVVHKEEDSEQILCQIRISELKIKNADEDATILEA